MKKSMVDVQQELGVKRQVTAGSPSSGISAYALAVAEVVSVNYAEMMVVLKIVMGDDQVNERLPVPLTFPSAGRRYFSGNVPQKKDLCVVGWMPQDSSGSGGRPGAKTPVILQWIVPGVPMGQDWMVTQDFDPSEYAFTRKGENFFDGHFQRIRHFLRQAQPGNHLSSSAQGSELFLNEGVLLSNRRGNEIALRDQDQAFVVRALQRFEALGGARTYSGAVQRDARVLPAQLFSDGFDWSSLNQVVDSELLSEFQLPEDSVGFGYLTPSEIFQRLSDQSGRFSFPENVDPFQFLQKGLYIDESGFARFFSEKGVSYGGKNYFRISKPLENNTNDPSQYLTEHRVEINHTTDQRLPVTEQTDGFDAERLEDGNKPYMEIVYGSVVGNDAFSESGVENYGLPLKPVIFEGDNADPKLVSALGSPLGEHGASLFSLRPPTTNGGRRVFSSYTKSGAIRMSFGSDPKENALEAKGFGGAKVEFDSSSSFSFVEGVSISARQGNSQNENLAFEVSSDTGAVRLYAGGQSTTQEWDFLVEARNTLYLKSSRSIYQNTAEWTVEAENVSVTGSSSVAFDSTETLSMSAKTVTINTTGRKVENLGGPKDNVPTNAPLRETNINSLVPGLLVDSYNVTNGNREEKFQSGNHSTTIQVGNLSYQTNQGTFQAKAGLNELSLNNSTGMSVNVVSGNIQQTASAGSATISGSTGVTLRSNAGQAVVTGSGGVFLGGLGKIGNIVSSSDLDPLTGLPLGTFGMGSIGHKIGLHIP
jgi:hypothetical protein